MGHMIDPLPLHAPQGFVFSRTCLVGVAEGRETYAEAEVDAPAVVVALAVAGLGWGVGVGLGAAGGVWATGAGCVETAIVGRGGIPVSSFSFLFWLTSRLVS